MIWIVVGVAVGIPVGHYYWLYLTEAAAWAKPKVEAAVAWVKAKIGR